MTKTIYLCGPMTGIPNYNFPLFHAEASRLRTMGFTVINPAETDNGDTSRDWAYYMRKDITQLMQADAVVVLPDWEKSKGAKIEVNLAKELGIEILDQSLLPVKVFV